MRKSVRPNSVGFSLIEVIVATVIIGLLSAGIFATMSYAKRVAIRSEQREIALSLIEARMNELKQKKASELLVTAAVALDPSIIGCFSSDCKPVEVLGNGNANGFLNTVITQPDPNDERRKEVSVRLDWTDPRGAPMWEAVPTYFFEP